MGKFELFLPLIFILYVFMMNNRRKPNNSDIQQDDEQYLNDIQQDEGERTDNLPWYVKFPEDQKYDKKELNSQKQPVETPPAFETIADVETSDINIEKRQQKNTLAKIQKFSPLKQGFIMMQILDKPKSLKL